MNGTYIVPLPLPGGIRQCRISLAASGSLLTGSITNPYQPETLCPITSGTIDGEHISFETMVGRVRFLFSGTAADRTLKLSLTTQETIPLEPGKRLSGTPNALAGEYLVGVYSPGGVKENHFVITEENGVYSGEMFCLMDEKTLAFLQHMNAGGGPMAAFSHSDVPPKPPQVGDKCDVNPFLSVTGSPENFEIMTRTGNGSLFRFTGSIQKDAIVMTLHVTDETPDLIGSKCEND